MHMAFSLMACFAKNIVYDFECALTEYAILRFYLNCGLVFDHFLTTMIRHMAG
jgi:hypothetical protein